MNKKVGKCIDCGKESFVTAGRCNYHYWKHRDKVNAEKKSKKSKEIRKKNLNVFFASETLVIPNNCEECNCDISYWKRANPRILIAHILPKREAGGFPEVSTHPKNRMFFCPDCHTNFDNKGNDFAKKMKSLPIMKERYLSFKNLIENKNTLKIPSFLND